MPTTSQIPKWLIWWRSRCARLRSCWSIPDADTVLQARLLDHQIQGTALSGWISDTLYLAFAVLALLTGSQSPDWGIPWIAFLAVWMLAMHRVRGKILCRSDLDAGLRLRTVLADRLVAGAAFTAGMGSLYVLRDDVWRTLIAGAIVAAVAGGPARYARLPQVAVPWLILMVVIAMDRTSAVGRPVDAILAIALGVYTVPLTLNVLATSRQFVHTFLREVEAERQKEMVQLLLSDVEGASSDWFWECDTQARLTHSSSRLADVLQQSPAQVQGAVLPALLAAAGQTPQSADVLRQVLHGTRPFRDLVVALEVGRRCQWWSLSGKPLHDVNGRPTGWRGVGVNVTEAHEHARTLERLAQTDTLTGLTSRHGFNEYLQQHLAPDPSGRPGPLALLMLDLDRFKTVNDAHGHGIGDRLLHAVGQRLLPLRAANECLARLGGDEFVLVVPGDVPPSTLCNRGEQVRDALRAPFHIDALRIEVRASLGVAHAPAQAANPAALLSAADMALYAAKSDGRDRLRMYDHTIGMTDALSHALQQHEFHLVYQPVFDTRTGAPVAAEALLRWTHPTQGETAPLSFISLAEETGLIVPIGAWVLRQACTDALDWPQPLRVSVNLSPAQLRSRHLIDEVRQVLADTGLPAARLEFELTETALATDEAVVTETLAGLRALGVGLALDDFGTGFSSLAYLQRFRFDRLKIDRSFVQALTDSAAQTPRALVGAIIGLADALGLPCTAEGIEHPAQRTALDQLGCGSLQGYLLARPMPMGALIGLLAQAAPVGLPPAMPAAPRSPAPATGPR
jgi:diguanylate cyclase (GGDEF)-like protein